MERIFNTIGFSLLGLCFVIAIGQIAWMRLSRTTESGEQIVDIRLAHWQLEAGIREALDELAREYMDRHPGVRVTQIPIPERIYPNWLITQLIGESPPDIIQLGGGITDERVARYFIPLTELAQQPNPYNEGTELEGVPLRETFFDGMLGGFRPELLEYYGVPLSAHTVRLYVNQDLLKEITGSDEPPTTYRKLIELCQQARAYGEARGIPLIPIAGSNYNSPILMNNLFASQTQKKLREMGPPGTLVSTVPLLAETFVRGDWSLRSPEVQRGLGLMRSLGSVMQPGFMQVTRDDASFYFVQGRALMICTGSWDATSVSKQARFPFRAVRIPLPTPDDPEFGEGVLGLTSEAGNDASLPLGVTNASRHPEIAMDFLLFLASQPMTQKFVDISQWLPSVVGVQPVPAMNDFALDVQGYTPGFFPTVGPDTDRLFFHGFHRLTGMTGSVEEFTEIAEDGYLQAIVTDLQRQQLVFLQNSHRRDVQLASLARLAEDAPEDSLTRRKFDSMAGATILRNRSDRHLDHALEMARGHLSEETE